MVERRRPNLVCLLDGSLSEREAAALEALPVSYVFVSPRWATGKKAPRANTAKVIWLENEPFQVGLLALVGLPCKGKGGDAPNIITAGLMSPNTPRVLVWSLDELQGKAAHFRQLIVIGAVVISFTFFGGHFFSMHLEEAIQ